MYKVNGQMASFGQDLPLVNQAVINQIGLFGVIFLVASVVYLLAANWFGLPDWLKLALPAVIMFFSALLSVFTSKAMQSILHTVCGFMLGLGLASIGQVYQTGADSSWLFIIWSLGLLPWLYRDNAGVYVLLMVVSELAVWLSFEQLVGSMAYYPMAAYLVWTMFWLVFGHRHPALSWFVLVGFLGLSLLSTQMDLGSFSAIPNALIMVTPCLLFFGYKKTNHLLAALALAGGGLSLFVFLITLIQIENLLFWAVVGATWFLVLSLVAARFFPNQHHRDMVQAVLLATSGWVSSLLALMWVLFFDWKGLELWVCLAGLLLALLGFMVYGHGRSNLFLRHLGYALITLSLGLSYISLEYLTHSLWPVIAIQALVAYLSWRLRMHWLFILIQSLGLYLLLMAKSFGSPDDFLDSQNLTTAGFMLYALALLPSVSLFYPKFLSKYQLPWRLVSGFVLVVMAIFSLYFATNAVNQTALAVASIPLLCALGWHLSILPLRLSLAFVPLGILAGLDHAGILSVLLVLAASSVYKDRLIYGLSFLVSLVMLWFLYYQLTLPFLLKFVSIFVVAMFCLALYFWLQGQRQPRGDL